VMKLRRILAGILFAVTLASGQQFSTNDAAAFYQRMLELMESTSVAVPNLGRAAAPVIENARQTKYQMDRASGQPSPLAYAFLTQLRGYLALSETLPRPFPFPEEASKQFAALRDGTARLDAHMRALLDTQTSQLRGSDRDNTRRYAEANSRLSPPAAGKPRVVFYGDSITDAWRLNEYFPDRDFVNRGISGQITGEMLGRMQTDVIKLKPAAMILLAGTNDIARGVALETIQNNLTMIADLAKMHQIKLILASVLPVSDYHMDKNPRYEMTKGRPPATINALNAWMVAFAKQRGLGYCNYFDAMKDASGRMQADLADDGLHPNSAGYRIMAPLALAAIDIAVKPAPAPPPVVVQPPQKKKRFPF
jgi:lysophospholipase L1-like esterase